MPNQEAAGGEPGAFIPQPSLPPSPLDVLLLLCFALTNQEPEGRARRPASGGQGGEGPRHPAHSALETEPVANPSWPVAFPQCSVRSPCCAGEPSWAAPAYLVKSA